MRPPKRLASNSLPAWRPHELDMVGRFASGCSLGAGLRFAVGRYAAGGAGVSGTTLSDAALGGGPASIAVWSTGQVSTT